MWRSFGSLELHSCLGNLQTPPSPTPAFLESMAKGRKITHPIAKRIELGLARGTQPQTERREGSEVSCQVAKSSLLLLFHKLLKALGIKMLWVLNTRSQC